LLLRLRPACARFVLHDLGLIGVFGDGPSGDRRDAVLFRVGVFAAFPVEFLPGGIPARWNSCWCGRGSPHLLHAGGDLADRRAGRLRGFAAVAGRGVNPG
jgi:hypothetical protein